MTISSVSGAQTYQPPPPNPVRQNFQQLSQALQSGDLSGAQAAYASLMQNMPNGGSSGTGSQNPFQQTIASIGSALQSGDLSGAQQALQSFMTQMKGAHHHHHHGQTQTAGTSQSSPPDNDGSSSNGTPSTGLFA